MNKLRSVDDVLNDLLGRVKPTTKTTNLMLDEALGHYVSADIYSPLNVPAADQSAMDGYAFKHADLAATTLMNLQATSNAVKKLKPLDRVIALFKSAASVQAGTAAKQAEAPLQIELPVKVSDRIPAGRPPSQPLEPGTVARIFTGGIMPAGADTVVIQEDTRQADGKGNSSNHIVITALPTPGENVRPAGQDLVAGSPLLEYGCRLTPDRLALAASVGLDRLPVFKPLRVALLATGDELIEPGRASRKPWQTYTSNLFMLAGLLQSIGMEVTNLGIVADSLKATTSALLEAAKADAIITTGGVSVGEEDHVRAAVEQLGTIEIWKLAIKPGKPLAYGQVQGVPIFGLPGNPVSSFVTFLIIARPYLIAMAGGAETSQVSFMAEAGFDYAAGGRREYVRVRTQACEGRVVAELYPNQGSGVLSSVAWGNALAEIEPGCRVSKGDRVKIIPY